MGGKIKFWKFKDIEGDEGKVDLRIDGEIVEDDYAWIYEWLDINHTSPNKFRDELSQHKGKEIIVWVDSWGGDVFAAAGIYNALKEHDGKVTVKVDGKAISAGSVIAMAGDEILMSPVSIMMIHNPLGTAQWAEAKEMRHVADVLDEVKDTIVNAYQAKTKRPRNTISRLMDEETWMSANKAVAEGFADGILYTDPPDTGTAMPPVQDSFMFSRTAIQNSISKSMGQLFERYKQIDGKKPEPLDNLPPKDPLPEPQKPNNEPGNKQADTGLLSLYQRLNQANYNRRYAKCICKY